MKILLVGANGLLGSRLLSHLEAFGCTVSKFQTRISDLPSLDKVVIPSGFDLIVNCSGLVGVDKCERDPQLAELLNSSFPARLAQESLRTSTKLIHFSTPSVFSGLSSPNTESDKPDSQSIYGTTKAAGDLLVMDINPNSLVLRINFVAIHDSKPTLANLIIERACKNLSFDAFDDILFNPVEVDLLAQATFELFLAKVSGLVHIGTDKIISKYEFAKKIYRAVGVDENMVSRVLRSEISANPLFSSNTSLINGKLKLLLPKYDFSEIDYSRLISSCIY